MIIENSSIAMGSCRLFQKEHVRRESFRLWTSAGSSPQAPPTTTDEVSLSGEGRVDRETAPGAEPASARQFDTPKTRSVSRGRSAHHSHRAGHHRIRGKERRTDEDEEGDVSLDARTRMLKHIAEELLGVKVKVFRMPECREEEAGAGAPPAAVAPASAGWGLEYELEETYREAETTAFTANGVINTGDGQEIRFDVNLVMAREFVSQESVRLQLGDAALVDPLVINFDGAATELTEGKFDFDLDADGTEEQVSFVGAGSGFLVLDRNGDGVVNDGSELFGPTTGDGFAELAGYDEDGNRWLDERDSVTEKLLVWTKDASGADSLRSLKDSGVGAIYLDRVETKFDVKGGGNQTLGRVAGTGLYVGESGTVGTMQQVDLAV